MGFPGQFRIPGHSGTDQKNKKAFTKWRKWQREDSMTYEGDRKTALRSGKYVSEHKKSASGKKWLIGLGLPVLLIAFVCGGWLLYQAGDGMLTSFGHEEEITMPPQTDPQRLQAFRFYYGEGNKSLQQGDYDEARVNFSIALDLAPYSRGARKGLVAVLEHSCENDQAYCEDALIHRNYLQETERFVESSSR